MSRVKCIVPTIILIIVASFMVFLYEPIIMFANNVEDFWFDFGIMIKPSFIGFSIMVCILALSFELVHILSSVLKKPRLYQYFLAFGYFIFITSYIHGNFLTGFLPSLDGTISKYDELLPNLVSIAVYILVAAGTILLFKKTSAPIKYLSYTTLAIFAMLSVSLVTTLISSPNVFSAKEVITTATYKNINTVSADQNLMILLVDTVDSQQFNKIVSSNPEYQKVFQDFSYFPDTVAGYGFTRDAVPFIFSGIWNNNETDFPTYSTAAYDNSKFFAELKNRNYLSNLYSRDYIWYSEKAYDFDNIAALEQEVVLAPFLRQEIKYALFKYLPYRLKGYSSADTLDFTYAKREANSFWWGDKQFYHDTLNQPIDQKIDQKYFQYVHIEGAHIPFNLDENVNKIENGTYPQKLTANLKIIEKYLNRLKAANAYDNSAIIIMADHSGDFEGTARQNPILYIKGAHETHHQMLVSGKQVSHADLSETFIDLMDGKKSTEIFSDVPTTGRVRRFMYNNFNHEEHMIEYEQTGKAWDFTTFKPTGRTFDL